ncbi:MAG: T9SS type A sorting domain-containing protein, partial [Chitinophagales bacterium]
SGYMSFYLVNYTTQGSVAVTSTSGGNVNPKIFNEGALIDAGANWDNYILRSFVRTDFYNDKCDTDIEYAIFNGNWNNTEAKYFGIRFLNGANFNYCWVRMSVKILADSGDAEIDTIRVFGYACEQTANTGIVAGNGFIDIGDGIQEPIVAVNMYPNPAQENLFLQLQNTVADKLRYTITDLQGREVLHGKLQSNNTTILVREIPGGMYIINVLNEADQRIAVQKFVKL